jgi:hypothetical protein
MKIRIRGNPLRVRLTPFEVAELIDAGGVENRTQFGEDPSLTLLIRLQLSSLHAAAGVEFVGRRITVSLPQAQAKRWAEANDLDIYSIEPWGFKLLIEKDLRCMHRRTPQRQSSVLN